MTFTKDQIINAADRIDSNPNLRNGRESTQYDLVYNNKKYPPILLLSEANKMNGGSELTLEDFGNSIRQPFSILRDLGFEINSKATEQMSAVKRRERFIKWSISNFAKKSGAPSAYIAALDWLSKKYVQNKKINQSSLFDIVNPTEIQAFYEEALSIQKDKNSYIFNIQSPSYGEQGYFSASLKAYKNFIQQDSEEVQDKFDIEFFLNDLKESRLSFSKNLISRLVSSLLAKPFVILTGLSGSGKTRLAQAFAMWICETDKQYEIVPVGADWTNREPLLGFPNSLEKNSYVKPENGVLDLILEASKEENKEKPYFLILDEMNLSHVERYFADFLSVMESNSSVLLHSGKSDIWYGVPSRISFPENLFIIGTVNIDETTYMFSPKVLDRASVIEFRVTSDEMQDYLANYVPLNMSALEAQGASMAADFVALARNKKLTADNAGEIANALLGFFKELKKAGAEFGYRSASEILRYAAVVNTIEKEWNTNQIVDTAIMQKLLPKVHGSTRKLKPVLETLGALCLVNGKEIERVLENKNEFSPDVTGVKYPISLEKIKRMYDNLMSNGFTSYAEA